MSPNASMSFERQQGEQSQADQPIRKRGERPIAIICCVKGYECDPCPLCKQFTVIRHGIWLKCVSCGTTSEVPPSSTVDPNAPLSTTPTE